MLKRSRPGFAAAETLFACVFAAFLLATGTVLLISSARVIYRSEQKLKMEHARRELLIDALSYGEPGEAPEFAAAGLRLREQSRAEYSVQWVLFKKGLSQKMELIFFAPPR